MQEGEIQRWQTVLQNVRNARRDMPETVRNWISTVDEWKPEIVLTDFEPLARNVRARDPHADDRDRQHQHARPLSTTTPRSSATSARTS